MTVKPRKQILIKFALLCLLVVGYFGYLSYEFGLATGGVTALLTWSFFVLCTPVADAGFLLDFPLRLLFGIRMVISEIVVWAVALGINAATLAFAPSYYDTTALTQVLHKIFVTPYPYWGVIILSGLGTFLSIRFGDELMDVIHHRDRDFFHSHHFKHELIVFAFFVVVLVAYYKLIASVGIESVFG
ncbi:MAG: hypothetical protein COB84_05665 [Rhodobacteraceae bacterium]|nr:MAG: hypothetical protein COB84_05665 [Paracoccaceae bacterium]